MTLVWVFKEMLVFNYSAMNAGKSTNLLQMKFNYTERGLHTIALSPSLDSRDGVGIISSRIGISSKSLSVSPEQDIYQLFKERAFDEDISAIFVDEVQFFTELQIDHLALIADEFNMPVYCYGLRTDAFGSLFPGSARLLAIADELVEMKTICFCGKKATFVLRYDEKNNVVKDGDQVDIGGNDKYQSVCRKHWYEVFSDI